MKSKRTRIILAASAATLLVAGLITFFILKNRNKPGTFEVKFALPEAASTEDLAKSRRARQSEHWQPRGGTVRFS